MVKIKFCKNIDEYQLYFKTMQCVKSCLKCIFNSRLDELNDRFVRCSSLVKLFGTQWCENISGTHIFVVLTLITDLVSLLVDYTSGITSALFTKSPRYGSHKYVSIQFTRLN